MNKKFTGYLLLALAIGIVLFQYVKYRVAPDFNVNDLQLVTIEGKDYPIYFPRAHCYTQLQNILH
jgi:hypothetical protein